MSEYDAEGDADFSNLWLLDVESDETRQLTHGVANNTEPAWPPSGGPLAFLAGERLGAVIFPDTMLAMLVLGAGWGLLFALLAVLAMRLDGPVQMFLQVRRVAS